MTTPNLKQHLEYWQKHKDETQWVLGTLYETQGHCYYKAGAMVLINGLGQRFGMLSGGCLESDIQTYARKVMQEKLPMTLCYDATDDSELSFQLGIGCGGIVYIVLQPVSADNEYQHLDLLLESLQNRDKGLYLQLLPEWGGTPEQAEQYHGRVYSSKDDVKSSISKNDNVFISCAKDENTLSTSNRYQSIAKVIEKDQKLWLQSEIIPPVHLLVVGGDKDVLPMVNISQELGWEITIVDPRPAKGRGDTFIGVHLLNEMGEPLTRYIQENSVDAVIVMSHSVSIDAEGIKAVKDSPIQYLALLGPINRRDKVLNQANVTLDELPVPLAGPAGLDIGSIGPSGIALSIVSECYASLHKGTGQSLSHVLNR